MTRFLIIGLAALGLFALFRMLFGGARAQPDVKCANCIHCRKLFHDGVMCGFRAKEVFKTPAHIEMCPDWERRPGT